MPHQLETREPLKLSYGERLRAAILHEVNQHPGITTDRLVVRLGTGKTDRGISSTVRRYIRLLEEEGLIKTRKPNFATFRDPIALYPAYYEIPEPQQLPRCRSREAQTLKVYRVPLNEIWRYRSHA